MLTEAQRDRVTKVIEAGGGALLDSQGDWLSDHDIAAELNRPIATLPRVSVPVRVVNECLDLLEFEALSATRQQWLLLHLNGSASELLVQSAIGAGLKALFPAGPTREALEKAEVFEFQASAVEQLFGEGAAITDVDVELARIKAGAQLTGWREREQHVAEAKRTFPAEEAARNIERIRAGAAEAGLLDSPAIQKAIAEAEAELQRVIAATPPPAAEVNRG
jgi:hypothetical protein